MSKRKSQGEHDSMIEFLADALYGRNLTDVQADISGYKKPSLITWPGTDKGYVPDVTAWDGAQQLIYEVESADSITDPHTEDQWKLFADHAQRNNALFYVAVPPMAMGAARKRLQELSLNAKVVSVP
ncbi:MAG: hypothetical protein HZB54_02215 [Deltaproteobacteria bacterium]|nr:hypothetical protein [Deltaproteobacteria bacterium]